MWIYHQATGDIFRDLEFKGTGYSGTGEGRNNPGDESVQGVGPIPRGLYAIGVPYVHPHLGPCVMNLSALAGTDTFGRSLFRIHGNNSANDASHGCIVLGPALRFEVANSNDSTLKVI